MNLPAKLFLLLVACIAIGIGVFITRKPGVSRVDWDSRTLEFHPTLKEKVLTADFTFTNAGNRPVRIEDVKSGCGCTTALPDKKDYAPGEKGHITATFTIGERTGLQKIPITVKFAGETPPVPLLLVAHIPVCMTVTPELLYWQIGDAPETKAAALHVEDGVQLQIMKVDSLDPTYTATLETLAEGKDYRVLVTPTTTGHESMAAINIDALISGEIVKSFTVFPSIKPVETK